jgi:hypothetical protein
MNRVWTDRSRIETFQRCNRLRWLEYHEGSEAMGITSARKPLPLAVGGSVHEGLAVLLAGGQEIFRQNESIGGDWPLEEAAVKAALADFEQFQLALDIGEEQHEMTAQLNDAIAGQDAELAQLAAATVAKGRSEFDQYLYAEQSALVEGLVRAYARRRLRPLLEQYEVLEVEREGSWQLHAPAGQDAEGSYWGHPDVWFMSRPDALLRERQSNQLYIMSFKTAADWDYRKEKEAGHDMQGLSEGVEVEKRLAEWWRLIREHDGKHLLSDISKPMWEFLQAIPSPPRILGIRYEYMLKGSRWMDKDLTAELGVEVRSQRSILTRAYVNPGMVAGDEQVNCSWDYIKEGGETSKLYYKNWKSQPIGKIMPVKSWIDKLDAMALTMGEEGNEIGWSGPAQVTGFLAEHPLDALFPPAMVVYRNDDDLRDWLEQVESQEVEVAEHVAKVKAAADEGEKRSLLNRYFQQSRRACDYPTACQFQAVCYGGEDIRRAPMTSGLYTIRTANHPQEVAHD